VARSSLSGVCFSLSVVSPFHTWSQCYLNQIKSPREIGLVLFFHCCNNAWVYGRLFPLYTVTRHWVLKPYLFGNKNDRLSLLLQSMFAGAISGGIVGGRSMQDTSMTVLRHFNKNHTEEARVLLTELYRGNARYVEGSVDRSSLSTGMLARHRLFSALYFGGWFLTYEFVRPVVGLSEDFI